MTDSKRLMVFIDGSNFYFSLKKTFSTSKIDLKKFVDFLIADNELISIKYYNAPLNQKDDEEGYKKQQKFFEYLKTIPKLDLYLGRLEKRPDNHKTEKGVDVKIAIDLLVNAFKDNYDVAILISNDADFIPAIEEVQKIGKSVYYVGFSKMKSYHLKKICDKTIKINEIKGYIL